VELSLACATGIRDLGTSLIVEFEFSDLLLVRGEISMESVIPEVVRGSRLRKTTREVPWKWETKSGLRASMFSSRKHSDEYVAVH
jgi:hypothetical protein